MSERGRGATPRKGPAKLGEDLDDVFAAKKAAAPLPTGGVMNRDAASGAKRLEPTLAEPEEKEGVTSSTIRIPHYLSDRISDYLHANKGDTLTTLFFKGLTKLGIEVEPGDLVPKRQRRSR